MIFAGANGYLDSIPVNKVADFEKTVLSALRGKHADCSRRSRPKRPLSDDSRAKLKAALDDVKKTYAA